LARELIILPRFRRDYRTARKHPEFDAETLEYVVDLMIAGDRLPEAFHEHRLAKREANLAGLTECQLGADLLLIYRVRRDSVALHRIGTHRQLFRRQAKKAASKRRRSRKG